jgi:hypothetical protein
MSQWGLNFALYSIADTRVVDSKLFGCPGLALDVFARLYLIEVLAIALCNLAVSGCPRETVCTRLYKVAFTELVATAMEQPLGEVCVISTHYRLP